MKQSIIEWLMEIDKSRAITIEEWQKAKAMYKEEIEDAFDKGCDIGCDIGSNYDYHDGHNQGYDYYNETYGGNK